MKYYYKITLRYDGTCYAGFQSQRRKGVSTIQEELNSAISQLVKSSEVKTLASGRTDAGVHALGQVVKVEVPLQLSPNDLKKGMNSLLPRDIFVEESEWSDENFHPIRDAKEKEYWYLFSEQRKKDPFLSQFVSLFSSPLNIENMNDACKLFIGEHDFKNFYCTGSEVKTTVRTIMEARIMPYGRSDSIWNGDVYCFQVRGNGFLKQMVRLMMGALLEVGRGKHLKSSIAEYLENEKISKLGPTAPPQGLYLKEVVF